MDLNTLLALVAGLIGLSDLAIARFLGDKLPPLVRTILFYGGLVFLLIALLFVLRVIKL